MILIVFDECGTDAKVKTISLRLKADCSNRRVNKFVA